MKYALLSEWCDILRGMTLDTLIMLAGTSVVALQFLAFPRAWNTVLLVLIGVGIIVLGIIMRRRQNPILAPRIENSDSLDIEEGDLHDEA